MQRPPPSRNSPPQGACPTIAALPPALVSSLRSGVSITSYAQAVVEVVANSLDAGASTVRVDLNPAAFGFSVADDGQGVQPACMQLLGTRYCTSKLRSQADLQRGVGTLL